MRKITKKIFGVEIDPEKVKTPYQLYRKLRPQYFSDSKVKYRMNKQLFKQVMFELSTEMKQDAFEQFTYQLVCRLITPNLIPQTGPMGGGDGKVDFETYPVDDAVSSKWYIAGANNGTEKWAFAVSCVTQWENKIKKDIVNALSTQKDYSRFFFCTNQPVPAKKKLKIQQDFKEKYQIDTTILDRTWYEEAVFSRGCYQIAIDTLHLGNELDEIKVEGPLDRKRQLELAEIDKEIQGLRLQEGINTEYIAKLLRAAILTRNLEEPWQDIFGRFNTAINEAKKYGLSQQLFEIHYQLGWTEFYWHEQPKSMFEQYLIIKSMLKDEVNPSRIEKVMNLLNLVRTSSAIGMLTAEDVDIDKENQDWEELMQKIKNNPNLPASAVFVQLLQLEMELAYAATSKKPVDEILDKLLHKVDEAQLYYDISLESCSIIIEEVGGYIDDNPLFEKLVDRIAEIRKKREGDLSFSSTHLTRGIQNIDDNNYVAAVKHIGKCIVGFQHEESRGNLILACVLLADAFNNLDLMNASFVFYTRALSLLFHEASNNGDIDRKIIYVHYELCRISLRQGDVNEFLNWYVQLEQMLAKMPQYRDEKYVEEHTKLDGILSTLILRSTIEEFPSQMPDILERLGLQISCDILLYKLGHKDKISKGFNDIISENDQWHDRWIGMIPSGYFLYPLYVQNAKYKELKTLVRGCRIIANCDNIVQAISYGRFVLALIESYFSTSEIVDLIFTTSLLEIKVCADKNSKPKVEETTKTNEYKITINPHKKQEKERYEVALQLLAKILTKNAMHRNEEKFITEKTETEKLGERLAVMSGHITDVENSRVLPYVSSIRSWISPSDKQYQNISKKEEHVEEEKVGNQANSIIADVIDIPLWDKAKWKGCGYITSVDHSQRPIMIFLYNDMEYGKRIFETWENKFRENKLSIRISIILGIDKKHPNWYKVLVSPDLDDILRGDKDKGYYVMAITRCHLMQANTNRSLEAFREHFKRCGVAGISAVEALNNQLSKDLSKWYPRVIPIRKIVFREAWTIGEHDVDSPAIQADNDPIIPESHKYDAPILKLLERKRKYV